MCVCVCAGFEALVGECNLKSQVTKPVLVYCKLYMRETSYLFNLTPCATHPLSMCTVLQIHAFSLGNVGQSQ